MDRKTLWQTLKRDHGELAETFSHLKQTFNARATRIEIHGEVVYGGHESGRRIDYEGKRIWVER